MSTKSTLELHPTGTDNRWEHIGENQGCADHDHDLVHELSRRLDAVWRYDQFIANAEGREVLQATWREFKEQEMQSIARLKEVLKDEIKHGCF